MVSDEWAVRAAAALLFRFGGLADELHELVELRGDDDLGAAVALLAQFGIVGGNGIVFTTTAGGETLRVYAIVVLQILHHARGT